MSRRRATVAVTFSLDGDRLRVVVNSPSDSTKDKLAADTIRTAMGEFFRVDRERFGSANVKKWARALRSG